MGLGWQHNLWHNTMHFNRTIVVDPVRYIFISCMCLLLIVLLQTCHNADSGKLFTNNETLNLWIDNADWYQSIAVDTMRVDTIKVEMIVDAQSDSSDIRSALDIIVVDNVLLVADYLRSSVVGIHIDSDEPTFNVRSRGLGSNETSYPSSLSKCGGFLNIASYGYTTSSLPRSPFSEVRRSSYSSTDFTSRHVCYEGKILMKCPETRDPEGAVCIYEIASDGELSPSGRFIPNIIPFPMQPSVYNSSKLSSDDEHYRLTYNFLPLVFMGNSGSLGSQDKPFTGVLHIDHPGFERKLDQLPPTPVNTNSVDMSMPAGAFILFTHRHGDHLIVAISNKLYLFDVGGGDGRYRFEKVVVFVDHGDRQLVTLKMTTHNGKAIITSGRSGQIYTVELERLLQSII